MKSSLLKISFSITIGICVSISLIFALQQTQHIGHAAGETLCVVPHGASTGPFAPCHQVFTSVQDAVDTAVNDQQIWIATGIYTDVHFRNNITQVVYLDKSVTLQGGYAIPFDTPPDPETNPTTLDAEGNGRVIYVPEDQNVSIIGLNLINGDATDLGGKANSPNGWGGGVFALSSTLTISQVTVADNIADTQDRSWSSGGFGGGIAIRNGDLYLHNSTIRNNVAAKFISGVGGGIAVENSEFHIENNVIVSNTAVLTDSREDAYGNGGGIAAAESNGKIINNQIGWNIAVEFGEGGNGGGIYFENETQHSLTMLDNNIFNNVALFKVSDDSSMNPGYGHGGGIFIYNPNQWTNPSEPKPIITATIHANTLHNNTASQSGYFGMGGGLALLNHNENFVKLSLKHNTISANYANRNPTENGFGLGGGVVLGGSEGILEKNVYISNTATISGYGTGSALYVAAGNTHSINELIKENNLDGTPPSGTVIVDEKAIITMTNTVIVDNINHPETAVIATYGGNLHLIHPTIARNQSEHAIYVASDYQDTPSAISITNGLLVSHSVGFLVENHNSVFVNGIMWHDVDTAVSQSPLANVTINNQMVGDPMFAPDGYHLTSNSEARFAGVPTLLGFDVDGEGRPFSNPSFGTDEYWLAHQYLPTILKSD